MVDNRKVNRTIKAKQKTNNTNVETPSMRTGHLDILSVEINVEIL